MSLFLVGGIVVLGIAAIAARHFGPLQTPAGLQPLIGAAGDNTLAVIGGLLAISLAAVCGAACESLTDITIRPLVKLASQSEKWSGRLRQTGAVDHHNFWLEEFKRVVFSSETYKNFPQGKNEHGLAVGILYGSGQAESIAWAENHYATYVMASNLALLSGSFLLYVACITVIGWCTLISGFAGAVASVGLMYTFMSLSLDRYLYSYQVAMRQSVVAVLQNKTTESQGSGMKGT